MTGITELDRIFTTVSVCRSFRLNGLQEILKRTKLSVKPVTLIWRVGELSARGYFDTSITAFIVDPIKAKEVIPTLKAPSSFELHKAWRDWYWEEFHRYFKADDLAELLFHEIASFEKHKETEENLEELRRNTGKYLWDYYDHIIKMYSLDLQNSSEIKENSLLKQAFKDLAFRLKANGKHEKAQEVTEYIATFCRYIEDLNRFDEVLSPREYSVFLIFLTDLFSS